MTGLIGKAANGGTIGGPDAAKTLAKTIAMSGIAVTAGAASNPEGEVSVLDGVKQAVSPCTFQNAEKPLPLQAAGDLAKEIMKQGGMEKPAKIAQAVEIAIEVKEGLCDGSQGKSSDSAVSGGQGSNGKCCSK